MSHLLAPLAVAAGLAAVGAQVLVMARATPLILLQEVLHIFLPAAAGTFLIHAVSTFPGLHLHLHQTGQLRLAQSHPPVYRGPSDVRL